MIPSSSGDPTATYTNIPNYILMYLFEQKRGDLSRTALKLYLYLRSKKNNTNGLAWPGVRTIVKEAHVSRNDVRPARDQIVAAGLISVVNAKGPRGTVLIQFNDEQILAKRYSNGITPSVTPLGEQGVTPLGEHTITNTITTLPNTKGKGKGKKGVRTPTPPSPPIETPDAKPYTTGALLHWSNTLHPLLERDQRPTYEEYLKHQGSQWEWGTFLRQWEDLHEVAVT